MSASLSTLYLNVTMSRNDDVDVVETWLGVQLECADDIGVPMMARVSWPANVSSISAVRLVSYSYG